MKKLNKKKIYIVIPVLLLAVFVCCFGIINKLGQRLSVAQIAELREQYPVCGLEVPPGLSMRSASLEEVKERSESFVYGEVVGGVSTYFVDASTGNRELDEKRKENGLDEVYEFYEYTISVIDDTEGTYAKDEIITIAANSVFMDYNPKLEEGMKVVVPVIRDDEKSSRSYYNVNGMYYVTADGYAISAFEEATVYARTAFSGVKVEELLKELKK